STRLWRLFHGLPPISAIALSCGGVAGRILIARQKTVYPGVASGVNVEAHFYNLSSFGEFHFIRKVFHQKNAPSAWLFKIFRGSGVREVVVVESSALVLDHELDNTVVKRKA